MKQEIKEAYEKYKAIIIGVVVVLVICLSVAWYVHDKHRNDTEYHNTDATVVELEKRIQSLETRISTMQDRIEQNKKTIESVARGISTSTGLTYEIIEGTGRAEERLDAAIGRSERIEGIIRDIETANR